MSYRKKHIKNKIYKIKPKKSVFAKLWFWSLILFIAIIFLSAYLFLFYPEFQVKNIEVSGNTAIGSDKLKSIILGNTATELINLWKINITSGSIFLVNTNRIEKEIIQKLPTAESATLNKKMPKTLVLTISERKPIGVLCNSSECFWIDKTGNIFSPSLFQEANTLIIKDTVNSRELFVGDTVLNQDIISDIIKIEKNLKDNFQINLGEALITSPMRLNIKTSENWQVYFDLGPNSNISSQLIKLNLLLGSEISQESRKKLRYIDLRPSDRAIICDNKLCGE